MKQNLKTISALMFALALLSVTADIRGADLIAPTCTLSGSIAQKAALTVSSEPPGLGVTPDGTVIGQTPLFHAEIEPGSHVVRIGDSKAQPVRPRLLADQSPRPSPLASSPKPLEPGLLLYRLYTKMQ